MAGKPLRRGDIVRIRDERWTVWRHVAHASAAVLDVRGCDRSNNGVRSRFLLPYETLERVPRADAIRIVTPPQWRRLARHALAAAVPSGDALRALAAARIDVHPFQLEPALAVVRGLACRVLIADDVGLGKTVQAGLVAAEVLERHGDARVLVMTPAALRDQWVSELQERFGFSPVILDALSLARARPGISGGANPWAAHPVAIVSVDYVKRPEVLRAIERLVWDLVIIDEAHGVAGQSERHAAAALVAERSRVLVMLSATPHSGSEPAFARLCGLGRLNGAFPLVVFRRTRGNAGVAGSRRTVSLRVTPTAAEQQMHDALLAYARQVWARATDAGAPARLAMMVLTKRACSSAASLIRSVERRLRLLTDPSAGVGWQLPLPIDGTADQDEEPYGLLGAPGLASSEDERGALDRILRLARHAHAAGESKLRALRRLLRRARQPALVFTEYRDTLHAVAAALPALRTAQLHGGLDRTERTDILRAFASGAVDVLLATDTASEGLNLQQRCRLVVDLELPWTPARLEQRVGRVDRIGQRRRPHQVHLVAARTSEELVVAPLLQRRARRVEETLEALQGLELREQAVAARVLGGGAGITAETARPSAPAGDVTVLDLRPDAAREAQRAAMARRLGGEGRHALLPPPAAPFAAALRRRAIRTLWAFSVRITDADEEVLWETLVGLSYLHTPRDFTTAADVRSLLDVTRAAAAARVQGHEASLTAKVSAAAGATTVMALARERAIVDALLQRQGHPAAPLVQRGLFDRRAERDAASRRETRDEIIAGCVTRLVRLERRQHALAQVTGPAFAVLLG